MAERNPYGPRKERKFKCVADAVIYILDHVTQETNGCWIFDAGHSPHGNNGQLYPTIGANVRIKGNDERDGHRVMWLAHRKLPKGHFVLHKCDNTRCVNLDHLFTGTQKINWHDMVQKGRHPLTSPDWGKYLKEQHSKTQQAFEKWFNRRGL